MLLLLLSQHPGHVLFGQVVPARYEPANQLITSIDVDSPESTSSSARESGKEPSDNASSAVVEGAAPSREIGPFEMWRVSVMANSLGAGFDFATSLTRHFDLRAGANFLSFGYNINVDGLHYDSDIHLRSGNLRLDWFPRHRNFHISPGILFTGNSVTALSRVPSGAPFELGDESFTNSTSDPVHGDAKLTWPRTASPMLTIGLRNLLPGRHEHISIPLEAGVAYTGAAKIDVTLVGTACQTDGCFNFAENTEAQQSLKSEVKKINDTLADVPIYPILSIGFGYRF